MSREEDFKDRGKRFFKIPSVAISDTDIEREFDAALSRFPVEYGDENWAKPGTTIDWVAFDYATRMIRKRNPNLVEPTMFKGAWEIEREAISMVATLLNHPACVKDSPRTPLGWFTHSGTNSMLQASWSLRNKFFRDLEEKKDYSFNRITNDGILRSEGILGAIQKGLIDINNPPVVLAPVDMHFAGDKSIDILGLGKNNIIRYGLTDDYKTDYKALTKLVRSLKEEGRDIMFAYVSVGSVDTGRVEDVAAFSRALELAWCDAPIIVDAAQQYMLPASLPEKYPVWDFREKRVAAIIVDPHKTDTSTYPASIILFRDSEIAQDTRNISGYLHTDDSINYDLKEIWKLMPSIPTSRSCVGPISTWVHFLRYGKKAITSQYQKIYDITIKLAQYIDMSPYFKLIMQPETGIVAFHLPNFDDSKARRVYSIFENSQERPRFYISYADCIRIKSSEDFKEYSKLKMKHHGEKVTGYGGLYIQIMNHASEELLAKLIGHLERIGKEI